MTTTTPLTAHRRGTRTDFLPRVEATRAGWSEVVRTAESDAVGQVAREVAVTIRRRDVIHPRRAHVQRLVASQVRLLEPDDVAEVRRPMSYEGMRNYIGRMCLPTSRLAEHAGWFESRNEQENYRLLLMERPVAAMATQPMRLEWSLPSGVRTHIPDAFYRTIDGRIHLLDITRRERLDDDRARAVFQLTQATAKAMGWTYQLRGELDVQTQRNVSFVFAHRLAPDELHQRWVDRARQVTDSTYLIRLAQVLGSAARPNYAAAFHLVATRHFFLDFRARLHVDTLVHTRPMPSRSPRCLLMT